MIIRRYDSRQFFLCENYLNFYRKEQKRVLGLMYNEFASAEMDFVNESIYEVMREIAPDIDDTIIGAMWTQVWNLVLFLPILTENGLCFAFNALNSHEIFTEA